MALIHYHVHVQSLSVFKSLNNFLKLIGNISLTFCLQRISKFMQGKFFLRVDHFYGQGEWRFGDVSDDLRGDVGIKDDVLMTQSGWSLLMLESSVKTLSLFNRSPASVFKCALWGSCSSLSGKKPAHCRTLEKINKYIIIFGRSWWSVLIHGDRGAPVLP